MIEPRLVDVARNTAITIGGCDAALPPFIYADFLSGCGGGRLRADDLDGNTSMFANMASFSVKVIEAGNPLELLDYECPNPAARGAIPRRHASAQDLADAG